MADFMPEIYRKLDWLSKEDLIKRMVSHEFNRFSEYYRNREEIEMPTDSRGERNSRGGSERTGDRNSRKADPDSPDCSSIWVRWITSSQMS